MTTIWPLFAQRSTHNKKENPPKAAPPAHAAGPHNCVDNSVEQEGPTARNRSRWYAAKKHNQQLYALKGLKLFAIKRGVGISQYLGRRFYAILRQVRCLCMTSPARRLNTCISNQKRFHLGQPGRLG